MRLRTGHYFLMAEDPEYEKEIKALLQAGREAAKAKRDKKKKQASKKKTKKKPTLACKKVKPMKAMKKVRK